MNEQDLIELKSKIDHAKTKVSELKGSEKQLMKDLKEDWECSSVEEAEKKVIVMDKSIEKLNEQIRTGAENLEEKYKFEEED